jgi:two-component system sensor kinase FixL
MKTDTSTNGGTLREQRGEMLAENEARLRALLECAVDAIISIDERGLIQLVNPAAEHLFGYSAQELIGKNVSMLMPSPYREEHDAYLARYVSTGQKKIIGIGREVVGRRKNGTTFPLDLAVAEARLDGWSHEEALGQVSHNLLRTLFPVPLDAIRAELEGRGQWEGELIHHNKNGDRLVVAAHWILHRDEHGAPRAILEANTDISERKQMEEALRHSQEQLEQLVAQLRTSNEEARTATQQLWQAAKLASVGELAASIAHELNNPLATVSLRIESLLRQTPEGDPRRRALDIVDQETKRMGSLVANLLQFCRRGDGQISTVDVRQEILQAVELVHHHLRKRQITTVQEMAEATPVIHADRQKLRQVFMNLLTNASDAMCDGGTLTLRCGPALLPNGKSAVQLDIADTGAGISAEHLQKVFDPFFTTKEEGKGTGLGLAICRRIVEEHSGSIVLLSEVGKGTTVRILLPAQNGTNAKQLRKSARME